ncbi:3639_t:CDS:2 [Acaulospora morrowiae]|uniref:3639_t:CDS:1 n=1 Tax=Acaulospora morrowiae TaxID=94023 RepID=A0A9N9EAZ8_9GLOM|nr:3639_t:CDS:2 [Acaulospora morrowiae]
MNFRSLEELAIHPENQKRIRVVQLVFLLVITILALTNTIPAKCGSLIDPTDDIKSLCEAYYGSMCIGWIVFVTYIIAILLSWKIYKNRAEDEKENSGFRLIRL